MLLSNIIKSLPYADNDCGGLTSTGFLCALLLDRNINLTSKLNQQSKHLVKYTELNLYLTTGDDLDTPQSMPDGERLSTFKQSVSYFAADNIGEDYGCILLKLIDFEDASLVSIIREAITTRVLFGHKLGDNVFIALSYNGDIKTVPVGLFGCLMLLDHLGTITNCSKNAIKAELAELNKRIEADMIKRDQLTVLLEQNYPDAST